MHGVGMQVRNWENIFNLVLGMMRDIFTEINGRFLEIWSLT